MSVTEILIVIIGAMMSGFLTGCIAITAIERSTKPKDAGFAVTEMLTFACVLFPLFSFLVLACTYLLIDPARRDILRVFLVPIAAFISVSIPNFMVRSFLKRRRS
jgi:hypothetical protein